MNRLFKLMLPVYSLLFGISSKMSAQLPEVSSGTIERIENFKSQYVTPRNVDVWLPENYSANKKFSVLYMHDGQMLYDAKTTWNKQAWEVDETAAQLMVEGETQDFIVVGVWNGGQTRHTDYFPQKPFESLSKKQKKYVEENLKKNGRTKEMFKPQSDDYLRFLVEELKPLIDKKYNVYSDAEHTFVSGSSMGGLISMYALAEYPDVFGGAACLSTHWPGIFEAEGNPVPQAFLNYLKKKLPRLTNKKLYFDHGDQTLDAMYPPLQAEVDKMMNTFCQKQKNSNQNCKINWQSRFFPGTDHSEKSWADRLDIPMKFLLGKP